MPADDLLEELAAVKRLRVIARRKRLRRSRADRYRQEIEAMKDLGASDEDISIWLRKSKRVVIDRSNIWKARKKWIDQAGA